MIDRHVSAALVAPPLAMLVFWAGAILAIRVFDGTYLSPSAASDSLFFFMFFGVPISYLGAVTLGLPVYRELRRRGRLRPTAVIVSSSALGALWAPLIVWVILMGPQSMMPSGSDLVILGVAALLGALAGAAGGATFVFVRGAWPATRPAS
jgi:hypothetical protein